MDITEEPRSKRADEEATTKPDVAYYYPAPYWAFEESDWLSRCFCSSTESLAFTRTDAIP